MATAVASGIQESLPVEGKALERAVASWIKEPLPVKSRSLCLWKVRNATAKRNGDRTLNSGVRT